jgi:hypothetical protein
MRTVLVLLPVAVALVATVPACAASHFDTVVEIAASGRPRACTEPFRVKRLNDWAFRVDACEGALYYRCSYARKTMGRTQCCHPVPDEASATALLGAAAPDAQKTCQDFVD